MLHMYNLVYYMTWYTVYDFKFCNKKSQVNLDKQQEQITTIVHLCITCPAICTVVLLFVLG